MTWPASRVIKAPWSAQQVDELNRSQADENSHGYTCPSNIHEDRALIATEAGWVCPACSYTQDWFAAGVLGRLAFLAPSSPKEPS